MEFDLYDVCLAAITGIVAGFITMRMFTPDIRPQLASCKGSCTESELRVEELKAINKDNIVELDNYLSRLDILSEENTSLKRQLTYITKDRNLILSQALQSANLLYSNNRQSSLAKRKLMALKVYARKMRVSNSIDDKHKILQDM